MRACSLLLLVAACAGPFDGGDGDDDPMALTTTVRGVPTNLAFVAFRDDDGGGAWVALAGTDGVYPFTRSGSRYSLAWACPRARTGLSATTIVVLQATVNEVPAPRGACHGAYSGPRHALTGTIAGAAGTVRTIAGSGPDLAVDQGVAFDLSLPAGTHDLAALVEPQSNVYRVALRRRIALAGDRVEDLDLTADGYAPETPTLTIENPDEGTVAQSALILAGSGLTVGIPADFAGATWLAAPLARLEAGDLNALAVNGDNRKALRYVHAPQPLTVRLPDNGLGAATATLAAVTPYPRVTVRFPDNPFAVLHQAWWSSPPTSPALSWAIDVTPSWLVLAGTDPAAETPDFSGLAGWDDAWAQAGTGARWAIESTFANATTAQVLERQLFDGLARDTTEAGGELTF